MTPHSKIQKNDPAFGSNDLNLRRLKMQPLYNGGCIFMGAIGA
ncbi:hypothetical protein SAMN05660461_4323 [Chitinophaga ginsengisegetis]|uniref:Uncharacterized protein n=1 Tax=Chitinophaga ginsengisegetis TaxID=393003 RepID=A0A1T5P758_9BACT|nr:hypothetical protein SAMN05660461_4323 [Chitinophaga ginsengisegetis]